MTGIDSSSPAVDRASLISESSQETREAAAHGIAAAAMYHQVVTGDPTQFRSAAQWIIENGRTSARTLRLDDDEYLHSKKLEHLEAAKAKVVEAGRIEAWTGSLFDVKDSPDIIALKTMGVYLGLNLTEIEKRPKDMLDFEDSTAAKEADMETLRLELGEVSEKLEQRTGLETINISLAVRQLKPRPKDTVTMVDVIATQKQILTDLLENAESDHQNRIDLIEALRTGKVSKNLRTAILSNNRHAFDIERPESPHDNTIIEELEELGVRSYNILKRSGVRSVGDLIWHTEDELKELKNMGQKSIDEIVDVLQRRGLVLRNSDSTQ